MLVTQQSDAFCKTFNTKQCIPLLHTCFLYVKITEGELSVAKWQEIVTFNVYNADEGFKQINRNVEKKNALTMQLRFTPLLWYFHHTSFKFIFS